MKRPILSVLLLILLNLSIFYANGFSLSDDLASQDGNRIVQPESSLFDVEREIHAIEDTFSPTTYSDFRPGPLNANNISATTSVSQSVQDEPVMINIDLEKQVVASGTPLNYVIQATRGLEPAIGETFSLDIIEGEYWGWYFYWLDEYSAYEDRIVHTEPIITKANGEYKDSFNPPASGRYTMVIRSSANYAQETRSFTVANFGLFWRVSREFVAGSSHNSVAYILNTTDFSPIPGVEVDLTGLTYQYDNVYRNYTIQSEQLFSGVSNDQGLVEIDFVPPTTIAANYHFLANLSATYNGETVYVSRDIYRGGYYYGLDGYSEYERYEFITTTDKPIYSPGETINARILLWENDFLKVTKEPAQTSFILKFLSPSQHVLLYQYINTNAYGIATHSFSLDIDSELGSYYIVAQKDETVSSHEIRVDKYEKPAFRVILSLDHEYVAPGNKVSGNISAEYYFGKPVTNSEVDLVIGDLKVLTGLTDLNGFWEFEYKLPGLTSLENVNTIAINVTVTDSVGREVIGSAVVQITDEIFVWSYVNPWYPKAEENISIYFGAYQYSDWGWSWWNWRPLANAEVKIKLYGIVTDTISNYILTLNSKTDASGQGELSFKLPLSTYALYSRFKGVVEVDAGDGREGSSTFYFSVDRNSVDIALNDSNFQAGETIELEIDIRNIVSNTSISGKIKFRMFDSDYDMIGKAEKEIPVQGSTFEYKLSPYAPNGKYVIYIYLESTFDNEYGWWTRYRYSRTVEFIVGPERQISLVADKASYSLTDSLSISGQVQGQTNAPVMIQFVKKGIVATEYISVSSSPEFNIQIDDIQFLTPRFWVFAFAILNDGTILEATISIEIDSTIIVEILSDRPVYEPGDTAKITIKVYDSKHQPISSVLAISFIDSSVFGVQPDPETEQEHFNELEYWPAVWTVVSWKSRQHDWWFWWYDDYHIIGGGRFNTWALEDTAIAPSATGEKSQGTNELSAKKGQEIRDNLPESAYWTPLVVVENGFLEINLPLPDTIGEWTVRVVATTHSGNGVLQKSSFKTFLPFFVEIVKEPFVLQDDVFILKGVVYNYLNELVDIIFEIETEEGILVLGQAAQEIKLPSGFLTSIGWACLAQDVGFFNITLYASTILDNGTEFADAIRKPLEIVSNGIASEFKTSGFVSSDPTFSYTRYTETIQKNEFLELSLGLGSVAITSWERLVGYPYGCIEQTLSRLIPDALVLEYLKETGQLTNETEKKIQTMIVSGLSRLYSQRHSDGGWGWWYRDSSRVYMTSLVLYGLGIINNTGIYVEPSIVADALSMLYSHQNTDGSWTPDSWRGVDQTSFTAFVLRSILLWKNPSSYVVSTAINYIETTWSTKIDERSTYLAGLYLNSVPDSGFGDSSFETTLLTYLKDEVKLSADGYFWSYATEEHYWWRALGGDVEITALALEALVENDPAASMPMIRGAVQWLLQRQSWYGWGNTADTAAAISCIISLSRSVVSSNEDVKVTLTLNGHVVGDYSLSTSSQPTIYLDLDEYLQTGDNNIELTKQGAGNVSYYFYGSQTLRRLPSITFPTEISTVIGQPAILPLEFTPTSSRVFASNITVVPLDGELTPSVNLPQTITLLTQQTTISFSYVTPSTIGTYEIPGFEISYQLANADQTTFSPGIIARKYGPVYLEVANPVRGAVLTIPQLPVPNPLLESERPKALISSSSSGLKLVRTYSQVDNFQQGDLIYVTLTITNTGQTENFIMLEDYTPVGFELDESTIQHPAKISEITTSGITFFFPELETGPTEIQYGMIAKSVRQSIAAPAKLSSMYDDWIITSSSTILGETRIPINPETGEVIKDLQSPVLDSITLEETLLASRGVLDINVAASDNWGVASVRVFIKQSSWEMFECSKENDDWSAVASGLSDGTIQIYVEIIDFAGNVLIGEPFSQYVEIGDLAVPILPILGLISVAFAVAIGSSLYLKKKY